MIPDYPAFKPLEKTDREAFDSAFRKYPPEISEYTFTNLYAWRASYNFSVSLFKDILILRSGIAGEAVFFDPIGGNDIIGIITAVLKDKGGYFSRIPETRARILEAAGFIVKFDADNSDYVYSIRELSELKGKKYDGKRNLIKKFRSVYSHEYIRINPQNIRECLAFEEAWCVIKNCGALKGLSDERSALEEMLGEFSERLIGAAIRVEDRLSAFCLAERLNSRTLVIHMLKAFPDIPGLYQTILNEFLTRLEEDGLLYLNMEQDLGVPGIRKSKLSYHPLGLVKKYTVRLA